ncbi:hypothetical protein EDD11_006509 [Mortierella claussenii]|nr:hypothetical protein EDD11_006509 [Mortierella claussenii]
MQDQVLALQELRDHIASHLNPQDLVACCSVSRQWHQDWNPIHWRKICQRKPKDLARHGHLIRKLDISVSCLTNSLEQIRDHCLNLQTLKIVEYNMNVAEFEERVLGIQSNRYPGLNSVSTAEEKPVPLAGERKDGAEEQEEQEEQEEESEEKEVATSVEPCVDYSYNPFLDGSTRIENGFLSSSLISLGLCLPPAVTMHILPRLVQARQAGRLKRLRTFRMGKAYIYYTCIEMPPEPTSHVNLSDVFAFLNAFPEVTTFSTGNVQVIDDIRRDQYEQDKNQQGQQHFKRLTDLQLMPRNTLVFQQIITRTPNLTHLHLDLWEDNNIFPDISRYCPQGLTSLTLNLEGHQQRSDDEWTAVFQRLPNLKRFITKSCNMSSGVVLKSLARTCPELSHFSAGEGSEVSVEGVSYMLQHCAHLKELYLAQSYRIDLFQGPHKGPQSVDEAPWRAPVEKLHFDIISLMNVDEHDIFRARMRQLPRLRRLAINYAYSFTLRAFQEPDKVESRELPEGRETTEDFGGVSNLQIPPSTSGMNREKPTKQSTAYPNVEELIVNGIDSRVPGCFDALINVMPRLRMLEIGTVYGVKEIQEARCKHGSQVE